MCGFSPSSRRSPCHRGVILGGGLYTLHRGHGPRTKHVGVGKRLMKLSGVVVTDGVYQLPPQRPPAVHTCTSTLYPLLSYPINNDGANPLNAPDHVHPIVMAHPLPPFGTLMTWRRYPALGQDFDSSSIQSDVRTAA